MSQFYTFDFEFDGVPSHRFDLKIVTFEDGGVFNGVGSSDVNILEQRVLRKSKPYYLGRTQETKLEFPLTFGRAEPVSALDRDMISAWLFGRSGYKKLYILQDDLNGAYFNCFLTKPEPLYIGGLNYAFTCQVICDSPWAYGPEHIISGSFANGGGDGVPQFIEIYNSSSEDEYLYPEINFTISDTPSVPSISLINISGSCQFSFTDLSAGEEIIVDNDLQTIYSTLVVDGGSEGPTTTHPKRISNFSKSWFRLVPRYNNISINANLSSFEIKYTERFKIGG
jgi:hypothetical protein